MLTLDPAPSWYCGGARLRGVQEHAIEHGIGPGLPGDRDHQVARDLPVEVDAVAERRDRLGVQHLARAGVADLDLLAAALAVPVEEVQLQVVRLAVGQVDIDGEAGGGVPDGGDRGWTSRGPARRVGLRRWWSRYRSTGRWA